MSITNFQSEKWTAKVELQAQENSIVSTITSGNYQMDADGAKSVKINLVNEITTDDYVPGSDITVTALTDTQKILTLDQMKYFAFPVDRVNKAQSQADFMSAAMEQAGKTIALEADKYVLGSAFYGDVSIPSENKIGAIAASIDVTSANIEEQLFTLGEILDAQNVPRDGNRWAVIPAWMNTKLALAGLNSQTDNMTTYAFGVVRQIAGFNVVMSNQVSAVGAGSDEYQIMAFSGRALPFATSVTELTIMERELQFASLVKGLYVFGAKTLFPKEVAVLSATKGTEA